MEELKFFRKSDCVEFPTRGTSLSAGLDFYIPKPKSYDDSFLLELQEYIRNIYYNEYPKEYLIAFNEKLENSEDIIDAWWITIIHYNRVKFNNIIPITYNIDGDFVLGSDDHIIIPSGITVNIPHNYLINITNKSGIASKRSLIVGACIIDEDYTGIIHFDLHNIGSFGNIIKCGEKIVQGIIQKSYIDDITISNLEGNTDKGETDRGIGGFGSTN